MELNMDSRQFRAPVTVLDTVAEQLADVDLSLPDYCPDIEKILKCTLIPKVRSRTLSGGQLQVEGVCVVNVLYVESEKKSIRCCEQEVGFSQSFSVRDAREDCVILTKTKSEYINCRALSPRRLVIHGAFSLYAKVIGVEATSLYTPEEQELELLKSDISVANLEALCQEQFNVSEEISVADKPAVESVLLSSASAWITEVKAVTGKLLVNGEIGLKVFYLTDVETGQTEKLDYILPFNQIIDCEGACENNTAVLDCEVMSHDLRLKNDILSDKPALVLDVKLCVTQEGYLPKHEYLITDAYSTDFETALSFGDIKTISEALPVNESFIEKYSAKIDSCRISRLLDIYADAVTLEAVPAEGGLTAKGKLNLCVIALNEEDYPVFIERSFDYSHPLQTAGDCNGLVFGSPRCVGISYRLADGNSVEMRCELKITGGGIRSECSRAVCDIAVDKDSPVQSDNCALTLYFAETGESVWDISKRHRTKPSLIMVENELTEPTLDSGRMLLIPKI